MHRIDGPGAGPGGSFVAGSKTSGTPSTVVTADWANAVQEEIAGVVEASGQGLVKADNGQLLKAIRALLKEFVPPGLIAPMARLGAPTGWLACDGQVVSRTTYADLFAVIGVSHNTGGEAATDFRLPDLRGVVVRGMDAGRGLDPDRVLGSYQADMVGPHEHQLQVRGSDRDNGDDGPLLVTAPDEDNGNQTLNSGSKALSQGTTETRMKNVAERYMIKT